MSARKPTHTTMMTVAALGTTLEKENEKVWLEPAAETGVSNLTCGKWGSWAALGFLV